MSDLSDFLLARVAEREAVARAAVAEAAWEHGDTWGDYVANAGQYASPHSDFAAHTDWPSAVLAECEAKRRIVDEHEFHTGDCDRDYQWGSRPCDTLLYLAAVYPDHPDYREEWKP